MKHIKKLLLLAALTFAPMLLIAQTVEATANDIKWSVEPVWPHFQAMALTAYNSSGSPYTEGISTGILRIDNNSIISNVQLDKDDYGVVRMNKDMSTQWLTPINTYPVAIAMFHDKVLVIGTSSVTLLKGAGNNFTGYLIDPKTGTILLQKSIYTSSEDFYEQPIFLIAPDGSSFKMVVRTSNLTKKLHFGLAFNPNKGAREYFDTKDLSVFDFDNGLNLKSTIKPVAPEGFFIGATTNKNGDIFLMTDYEQGFIKIARYEDGKTTPAKTLQVAISMNDDLVYNLVNTFIFTSKADPSVIFFAGTYSNADKDREAIVAKFNFKDGTVANNIQVMDKTYLKDLAKSYVPFSKKFDDVELGMRDEIDMNDVVEDNGRLIVSLSSYSEHSGNAAAGTHTYYNIRDLIVNIYDNKTNLQYQQIVPRKYSTFGLGFYKGGGFHCNNNTLYITTNNNKGWNGNKALFSTIDLKTGSITNIDFIPKNHIRDVYPIDPGATLWFDNKFIISYIEEKGWSAGSEDAHMQLVGL